jgi:hypothetical protein
MGRPIRCPQCGHEICRASIRPSGFQCPWCGESLRVDTRYAVPIGYVSLILAGCLSYLLGISGYMFLLSTIVTSVPIFLFGALLNRWFFLKLASSQSGLDLRITGPRHPPSGQ